MAAEKEFPSPFELEVASALLLLSTTVPGPLALISLKNEKSYKKEKMMMNEKSSTRLSVSWSNWSGSSSSIASDDQQWVEVITMVTAFHDMVKLTAARKRRSKTFCISDCRKIIPGLPKTKVESLCFGFVVSVSGSSSAISSARSRDVIKKREHCPLLTRAKDSKPKTILGSSHMRRQTEAILKVLTANGSVSEVRIRQLLGDNPSTSKALRMRAKISSLALSVSPSH